jgi:Flp pilus assembly protein TadG
MKRTTTLARLRRLRDDESGMSLVYVAVGFFTFMAASTLAIDVGMFMTARSQAQNAADAGALAGAVALVQNSYTDRTSSGPVVQSAISTAQKNLVIGGAPSVAPTDVSFPNDPAGNPTRVRVNVYRTTARNSAIPTLIGPLFGVPTVDIGATATAEASPANSMTCVKPFMIPDKWIENSDNKGKADGPWTTSSTFDIVDSKNNPLPNPDVYVGADKRYYSSGRYTGYTVANDVGTQLVLRAGTGNQSNPSFYYSWKMPGDTGGNFYRNNIANCNWSVMTISDLITQEPGDMSGPTIQGINDLILKDPGAKWDGTCKCVIDSAFGTNSPRVFPIPLFDPLYYAQGQAQGRTADFRIGNFLGFFVDYVSGNQIYGRITNIVGIVNTTNAAPVDAFPKAIRLVQ